MGDTVASFAGLQQSPVQCRCFREKQVDSALDGARRDLFPPAKDTTGSHVDALSLTFPSLLTLLSLPAVSFLFVSLPSLNIFR